MDHLNILFKYFGFEEVTSFDVFSKSDSDRLNIALANLLGIPHSLYDNHNLNFEVEDMHNNNQVLCELGEKVGRVGSYVRKSCKKPAIICQFTNIRAVDVVHPKMSPSISFSGT